MTRAVLVALLLLAMVAGPAIVELYNLGEDDHDLALRRAAPGPGTLRIGSTRPGGVSQLEAGLAPGRYVLWCTIADHRELGMLTHLTVLRARPARSRTALQRR
jgi:hypothetical protein